MSSQSVAIARLDYPNKPVYIRVSNEHEAGFRAHPTQKEPWTVEFCQTMQSGDVLYDLGANVGSYALIAAALGHTVVAFEPGFASYAALCHNATYNHVHERLIALPIALGAENRLDWLHYRDLRAGAASHVLGQPPVGDRAMFWHRLHTMVMRLDDARRMFGLPDPTHLKLDVDGSESAVLEGARETLALPGLKALMLEMKAGEEQKIVDRVAESGFALAQQFTERGGRPIGGVSYGYFRRAA